MSVRKKNRLARMALMAALAVPAGLVPLLPPLAPLLYSEARAAVFNPESFTLDNGMQVILLRNDRVPVVTHMVWYKVGAADEAPGKSGIAHFLEHLMFKGTDDMKAGDFSKIIARNGGQDNAFTSWDYTAYHQTIASDRLELVMKMEADRMTGLILTDPVVLPERDVILEERNSRIDTDPGSQLSEAMRAALFVNHPYGTPIIGWRHEMEGLTTEDALGFYRRWYRPNNAILVVAGDITMEKLKPLAEKFYGPLPAGDLPERERPREPRPTTARELSLKSDQVSNPLWRRHYLAPSFRSADKALSAPLQVMTTLLCDGATSRLYRGLQVDSKIASAVGCYYDPDARDQTAISFYAIPTPGLDKEPGKALDQVEQAVESEINRLLADGPTEEEVSRARDRLLAEAVYARDDMKTGARVLGAVLAAGGDMADVEEWPDRIRAVTAEQVHEAARAVLTHNRSVTGRLLPDPTS